MKWLLQYNTLQYEQNTKTESVIRKKITACNQIPGVKKKNTMVSTYPYTVNLSKAFMMKYDKIAISKLHDIKFPLNEIKPFF